MLMSGVGVASARSNPPLRAVGYHGYKVLVPRSWPVFDLARDPRACVRFDRHALYLGTPSSDQRCPAHAVGRAAAILLEPAGASAARTGNVRAAPRMQGSATSFVVGSTEVRVTATWSRDRAVIMRALHRARLPASGAGPRDHATAHTSSASARTASAVYTGLAFDACSAPSSHAMAAWSSSPYRALGIYIGGANAACSQPNLTASWVSSEVAAGWHFLPTYVGLQAPTNSCGCAGITPSQASAQGTSAAEDAVAEAQSLGIPAGNPIYDDMESYARTQTNSSAVLNFLSGWTSELHALGYTVRRVQQRECRDHRPRRPVRQQLPGARRHLDRRLEQPAGHKRSGCPQHGVAEPSARPPVPGRPQRDLRWRHDQHRQRLPRRRDRRHERKRRERAGAADGTARAVGGARADGTTNLNASWSSGSGLASWRVLAGRATRPR